ncbi:MAG: epimerase [Pseudobutyrivibrio sp.]|uniref:epimerase n=1 Tax=Pseudobutyrivibrio sp. TaxID=2014367 RepID=UPI0025F94B9A|nr:epimerase [Pseudobutyrivibrio sp.]MBQ6464338.1 epimerase [Pseudobutyrivibrio sp.]
MDILILGGTGAMGVPLIGILSQDNNNIYVTSRSHRENKRNVEYLCGNAKTDEFFLSLMERDYDVIFDFLVYTTEELERRLNVILEHTKQYFFFSSSRCYADSMKPITEDADRLVDVCYNPVYLALDEYGMAKGREENLLRATNKKNWTIIRPYITYNDYRLQLGVYEKENWLKRALEGRTIVFPKDIAERRTSLTYGPDVAAALAKLIGNEKALGEAFHITTTENHTWGEILDFYCSVIEKKTGNRPKVLLVEDSEELQNYWNPWQIKYDRLYNRIFDNSKIEDAIGNFVFKSTFDGLEESLSNFIDNPKWLNIDWRFEAWCDYKSKEFTPLGEIEGIKTKINYIKCRATRWLK